MQVGVVQASDGEGARQDHRLVGVRRWHITKQRADTAAFVGNDDAGFSNEVFARQETWADVGSELGANGDQRMWLGPRAGIDDRLGAGGEGGDVVGVGGSLVVGAAIADAGVNWRRSRAGVAGAAQGPHEQQSEQHRAHHHAGLARHDVAATRRAARRGQMTRDRSSAVVSETCFADGEIVDPAGSGPVASRWIVDAVGAL